MGPQAEKSAASSTRLHRLVQVLEEQPLPSYMRLPTANPRPSRRAVEAIVHRLHSLFFPGYFHGNDLAPDGFRYWLGDNLRRIRHEAVDQVQRALCFRAQAAGALGPCRRQAEAVVDEVLERLPGLRSALAKDAEAAYAGDPAATSVEEAIFSYPGLVAIAFHRIAHEFYLQGVPLIARMMSEIAHSVTGIDIHPGASIGHGFFIDHGTGVVIGETCVLGQGVRLYQGVTLGARSFPVGVDGHLVKGIPRHPILEDDVTVYAGATILGRITVGRGSQIGGNVWLTESVPAGSRITQHKPQQEIFGSGGGI